jgi:outer membrane receptor for ferrienterochelin and colicin
LPGHYEVRFSHIGHRAHTLKNVAIQPDLRTRDLEPTDVELPEVTVVLENPLIQTDVTGSRFQVTDVKLNAFPVDNVTDILHLKPGVTMEGNVRGGRTDEVLYLIDGLPVKDVLAGEMSVNLPKSSIAGMSITTGGFEPEYGNALSGVVNVVTKSGTNESHYLVKADKDNLFGGEQNSNTNDFDLSASGPQHIFARPPYQT